jgi:hypothetical protein
MTVLLSTVHETATLANIKESLDHEYNVRTETEQLLADLKDKEAVAREMIAILRGVRGRDARYDRKAALKVLARVKQKRVLVEQSLRLTQNRLRRLVACGRDNVTADAAGRIGIFPLDLPELLHEAADSG